jgi:hypothetical protein
MPGVKTRLLGIPGPALRVVGIVVAAGGFAAFYAAQATQWAVMTDELQTAKLATSAARTLSPVPRIHGEYYAALNQLYPLFLSPLYGLLSAPDAFTAAHVLNAFLLASSAWPAYLLGRVVTGREAGGYFAAALTAFTPWLVLSSTLLTENAAYPAFVWAILLCERAIATPSPRRDALALAGVALAYLARTQLFVLGLALPMVIVAHERSPRRAVARHRLLAAAYGAALIVAAVLAVGGMLTRTLGNYSAAIHGNVFPWSVWRSAAVHLDAVVIGVGVAPFLLGVAWTLATLIDSATDESRAFALLVVALTVLLTLEAASFDVRFTPGGFVQDRYVCYLAPLFAVAAAACLLAPSGRILRSRLVLATGLGFAVLAALDPIDDVTLWWASPAGAFHRGWSDAGAGVGLTAAELVRWSSVVMGVVLAAALWRIPGRPSLAVAGVVLTAYGAFEARDVFGRLAVPATTRPQTIEGVRRDWVDAAAPRGARVALLPSGGLEPEYWWDAEFWNKSVDRVLAVDGRPVATPFAVRRVAVDRATGRVRGAGALGLVVVDDAAPQLRLVATRIAVVPPLALVRVHAPYRAEWLVTGAEPDGWARPGRPVTLRFFGGPHEVTLWLRAPAEATRPEQFVLSSSGEKRVGGVAPGAVVPQQLVVCGAAKLTAVEGARLPDGRLVSLHLDRIEVPGGAGLVKHARC